MIIVILSTGKIYTREKTIIRYISTFSIFGFCKSIFLKLGYLILLTIKKDKIAIPSKIMKS